MVTKSKRDHPPAREGRDATRSDLIKILDVLRRLPPRERRFLRDYPINDTAPLPAPSRDKDILTLVNAGFLARHGSTHRLTPLGLMAQEEIWAAERCVANLVIEG